MIARAEAIGRLREQRATTLALIDELSSRARTTPGLGGGEWSAKDLLGHLESWERHALDALAAWGRDEPAPIVPHDVVERDQPPRGRAQGAAIVPRDRGERRGHPP
jgi:hypothetical protein